MRKISVLEEGVTDVMYKRVSKNESIEILIYY